MAELGYDYVIEGKISTDNAYELYGFHEEFSLTEKDDYAEKAYLPDSTTTDSFNLKLNTKKGEEITLSTKCMPVTLDPFKKFYLESSTADTRYSIGIINKKNTKYTHSDEAIIKSITLTIPENDTCELSFDFSCESMTFNQSTDYADGTTITHGSLPTTEPLTTIDVSNVMWGTIPLNVSKFDVKIDYNVVNKWDMQSQKMRYYVTDRKITVDSLEFAETNDDFVNAVTSKAEYDFSFTIGGQTVTVKKVRFPEQKLDVRAGELVTSSFSSLTCSNIVFGF
jgi:hypothetical protein